MTLPFNLPFNTVYLVWHVHVVVGLVVLVLCFVTP